MGFDSEHCGCVLRRTHRLPCTCELVKYAMGVIPLNKVNVMWINLSFSDLSKCDLTSELSIQQEWDVILFWFKEVYICGKATIKDKLREIIYPDMTTMCYLVQLRQKDLKRVEQTNFSDLQNTPLYILSM